MPYAATTTTLSSFVPSAFGALAPQDYPLHGNILLAGDTDTIAQAEITPDDYVEGSTTEPELELELGSGGSSSSITVTPTPGGGGEDVTALIREHAGGTGNDFTKLRAIHLRAVPADPALPSSCKLLVIVGDLAAGAWERAALPLGYDSADVTTGSDPRGTAESECLLILPRAHTYATIHPVTIIIYQAANVLLLASFLGK